MSESPSPRDPEADSHSGPKQDILRPFWIPSGVCFEDLPEHIRTAAVAVINPIYQDLVLDAPNSLECSTGLTLVFELWQEVLYQGELGLCSGVSADEAEDRRRERIIDRLHRTVDRKLAASKLLHRLREAWRKSPDPLLDSPTLDVRRELGKAQGEEPA